MTTTNWGNICRICSSPADYEVFAKIPNYLHATSHEFQNWQKPINVLLEETTGLKVSTDDGLPRYMCALCISYLKHAALFREQAINNALGLKAVQALHATPATIENAAEQQQPQQQRSKEKESLLITAKDLSYSEERKTDTNLLYSSENRDKVRKQLLNNAANQQQLNRGVNPAAAAGAAVDNDQIRYLNLLFGKDINSNTTRAKSKKNTDEQYDVAIGSDPYAEDFQTASSDENDANEQKPNFFSYREKNFEEDDVMDLDELKDAITINIPESCKERKCRACFRRFMFEESYKEHMDTCIEYKFLITIEEINRLLDIRRGKSISPHEFIRRMIFCLRKTCEWLKLNCGEMLLPDLLQNGESAAKKRLESEGKSSTAEASSGGGGGGGTGSGAADVGVAVSSGSVLNGGFSSLLNSTSTDFKSTETQPPQKDPIIDTLKLGLLKADEKKSKTKMTDFTFNNSIANNDMLADFPVFGSPKPLSRTTTPISVENNVLYEIERSQSRNKREILLPQKTPVTPVQEQERITFLQKLQNATNTPRTMTTPIPRVEKLAAAMSTATPANLSPLISVRKDLLPTLDSVATTANKTSIVFSARCNLCNTPFATVAELEEHNAVYHNAQQMQREQDERDKIIALFEESSDD